MTHYLTWLATLLSFQWIGEWISARLPFPLPGPVAGMLLLLGVLFIAGEARTRALRHTGKQLIQLLPLWFIPAGAGVLGMATPLAQYGWALAAVVLGSTLLTFVMTLVVSHQLTSGKASRDRG